MPGAKEPLTVISFGQFEADLQSQELKKQGLRLRLSPQSFQILQVLLERPGKLVTREEFRQTLWPADTFVDFEHGLNAAVNRLRECLGEDAEKPRYIETLPRRGYRLIAPMNGSRAAIEPIEPAPPAGVPPAHTDSPEVVGAVKQNKRATVAAVFAVLILLGAAGFGVYSLLHRPTPTAFQKFTITQVTDSGKASRVAISPDGRYVLSVMDDNGMESLWLRNVPTGSDTQVIPPSSSHYESLTFSPDGNYIYFRKAGRANDPCCNLYRAPMWGGAPQTVVRNIDSGIAFSPDGQRIAYVRYDDPEGGKYGIVTASLGGDSERVLQTGSRTSEKPLPFLAWSARDDGISYSMYSLHSVEQGVGAIDTLNLRTGKSHRFVAFKSKFPDEIRWSPDGHTLFINYRQTGANWSRGQIGFLRDTGTEIEPITRDTNRYTTLTLSADGRTIATVLARSYASIYVLSKVAHGFAQPRALLSQSNEFDEWSWLNWGVDGHLLVSNTGRLFKLGADGKSQTELLADSRALIVKPSPCGTDYLVLTWTFHGGTNVPGIWRTNADGSGPVKLTDGKYDFYPVCSPDQKWVYYLDFTDGHVYRVPLNGSGKREPILPQVAAIGGLSVSPDGKMLAAAVSGRTVEVPGETARIALLELGSSSLPRLLPARHYADDMYGNGTLRFTRDGKSVAYVSREKGVDNVWVQPLDGPTGYPITDFKSERIWSFAFSPNGKSLGILRGHYDSDVVLLRESKQ